MPAGWHNLEGFRQACPEGCICCESVSSRWCYFLPYPRFMSLGVQGWKGECHHSLLPRWPTSKKVLPLPMTLCSAGLEISVPKRRMVPPRNTALIATNWKLRWWPGHFALLMFLNQQAKGWGGSLGVGWGD